MQVNCRDTKEANSPPGQREPFQVGQYIILANKFIYVNRQMADFFCYSPEDMIQLPQVLDAVMPEDQKRLQDHMEQWLKKEEDIGSIRFLGRRKDGRPVWLEADGGACFLQDQWGLTGVVREVTRCWQREENPAPHDRGSEWNQMLEQRIQERTVEMEAANQQLKTMVDTLQHTQTRLIQSEKMAALGRLVAGVAHEINTPVGIGVTAASHLNQKTKQFAELYAQNKMKKSDLEKFVAVAVEASDIILSNLQHAAELIAGFKEVAVDQSSEAKRRFHVRKYIKEVLLSLRPALKKTRHQVIVNCPDDLEIDSYPGALSQIITNLIINSLVHAYEEDDTGKIILDVAREGDEVRFNYSNDGKAMDPETLSRIFEPFFTTRRGRGGTGLGMPTIYNLVTAKLGGTIHCESMEGRGTIFFIRFPLGGERSNNE